MFLTVKESLNIAWQGMLAVFVGIAVIYVVILFLTALRKRKK
ncbi:MAG TPA: hypothetical protein VIK96_00445 [Bacilli bacterium]